MRRFFCFILSLPLLSVGQEIPDKDLTFNNTGYVINNIWHNDRAHTVVVQPDKKIIVGGQTSQSSLGASYALVRYNEDGSLDSSFGNEGIATSDGGSCDSMILLDDGKIIIAGQRNTKNFVARLLPDGSPDETFGQDGIFNTGNNYTKVNDIAVLPDGSILCAGQQGYSSIQLQAFKLTPEGEIDTLFGDNGFFRSFFGYAAVNVNAILVQPDEKFIIGGSVIPDNYYPNLNNELLLARFNPNGTLDSSFGNGGVQLHVSSTRRANDLAFTSDFKIIAVGEIDTNASGTYGDVVVTRFNTDGSLDESFGEQTGFTRISVDSYAEYAGSVIISPDNKIYLGGSYWDWSVYHMVVRFNEDGTPDTTFGNNGIYETSILTYHVGVLDMAFTPDYKLVMVGYGNFSNNFDFVTIRLLLDITLSTENIGLIPEISLFPNPVTDVLNIKAKSNIDTIHIYDIAGKLLFSKPVNRIEESLNISQFSSGNISVNNKT